MKKVLPFVCLSFMTHHAFTQTRFPEIEISNEHLRVKLYVPDAEQGYYRSTRFDWSGVIGSLEYQGHQYFGNWLEEHDPINPESISGPVEAFAPIGFEEATPGESFLVIGVGMLRKPDDRAYQFMTQYEIVDAGEWAVSETADEVKGNAVTFVQTLSSDDGYAYEYTKTVRLIEGQPEMVLEHSLKNTGERPLETTAYNHNFFIIDQEPSGPNVVTKFPYPVRAEGRGFGDMIVARDNQLVFEQTLPKGEYVFTPGVVGFGPGAEDYDIRIENSKSGAGVRITADQPLLKLVYWASATTACPEPYIQIEAAPGQTFTWNLSYRFYTLPASASGER